MYFMNYDLCMPLMKKMNKRDPSTEPCGTPCDAVLGHVHEYQPLFEGTVATH